MRLRELELNDADFMLEWMLDDTVVHDLQTDFLKMTIDDCKNFIRQAEKQYTKEKPHDLHYAITDEEDENFNEYLGTVSLKNINYISGNAEFAIAVRNKAMGRGLARLAMRKMTAIGFEQYNLNLIYWYVSARNIRANRFYEKNGYKKINYEELKSIVEQPVLISDKDFSEYIWYFVKKGDNRL